MKIRFVLCFGICLALFSSTAYAYRDNACWTRCINAGSVAAYCNELCSYGDSGSSSIDVHSWVPPYNPQNTLLPGQTIGPALDAQRQLLMLLLQQKLQQQQQQLELQRQQTQQEQPRRGQPQGLLPTGNTQYVGGKYKLKNYKIQYSNGQILTENDVKVSGNLEISGSVLKAVLTFGNQTTKGQGDIVNQNRTSGTYTFMTESGKRSGDFEVSGDNSIILHAKNIEDNKEVESWATWVKNSD